MALPLLTRRALSTGILILPWTYVYGRYALAVAERQHGFSSVRSNLDIEGGHAVLSSITLRGIASWQIAHKGPIVPELAAHDWIDHGRFIVSSFFNPGGGLSVAVTRNTELHALWMATVFGRKGAHVSRMLSFGASWNFGSSKAAFSLFEPDQPAR